MTTDKLALLPAYERRLATLTTVPDAKELADQAEAVRVYVQRRGLGLEAENRAAGVRLLAERRAGELLATVERSKGGRGKTVPGLRTVYRQAGISQQTAGRWQAFARVPETPFRRLIETMTRAGHRLMEETAIRLAREYQRDRRRQRDIRRVAVLDPASAPTKCGTIVVDPPWDWGDEGDVNQLGRARADFATVPFAKLLKLPVPAWADDDCHLYLWVTNRSMPKAFELVERWGFRYITIVTWCKPTPGMGNYFRGSTEHVLFGVRGSQPLKRKDVGTWFAWPRGAAHSEKPEEFYPLVESCSPGPYADWFGRTLRLGWRIVETL